MGIHAQQSYVEENFVNSASPVFDGKIIATTSSSANASISLPHGEDPDSPEDGDLWTTTSGLYVQINEETVGPLGSGGGGGSGDIFYQSASPVAPSVANIWVDSDETPITLNTNDFMQKTGGTFNGNVNFSNSASFSGVTNFTSASVIGVLPPQTGNEGKFLTTDGTDPSWSTVDLTPYAQLSGATFTGVVDGVSASAAGSTSFRRTTMSTSNPTGGSDGDVWLKY